MTTKDFIAVRDVMIEQGRRYEHTKREYNDAKKEFLVLLTAAKNKNIIGVKELALMRSRLKGKTFEEVGKEFDVTRERVRSIEAKVMEKMMNI